jgi:hypothetical protein
MTYLDGPHRTVSLPDEDADIYGAYLHWLHTGKVPSKYTTAQDGQPQLAPIEERYRYLAILYDFGEKIQDRAFQNAVSDMIVYDFRQAHDGRRHLPRRVNIKLIYDSTPLESPARKLMVDMIVAWGPAWYISTKKDETHINFLADVAKAFMTHWQQVRQAYPRVNPKGLESGKPSRYHHYLDTNKIMSKVQMSRTKDLFSEPLSSTMHTSTVELNSTNNEFTVTQTVFVAAADTNPTLQALRR